MPNPPLVAVLAYDGLCAFEFGIAHEVFGLARPEMGPGWYRFRLVAAEPGELRVTGGLTVRPRGGLAALRQASLIIVPGWRGAQAPVPAPLIAALQAAHRRGARIASLCSGVFVLAAAGLLEGRRATTHWRYAAALAAAWPGITIEQDVLYVDAGSILTAAGSAAGIDLCLHIVRRDFGAAAANRVARRLVVPPHRDGGQAQFIERPVAAAHEGRRLGLLQDWMRDNLGGELPLAMLAGRAGMSLRSFQRRFEAATGMTPGAWIIQERLHHARALLEASPPPALEDVAMACGFGSAAILRHHFRRRLGTTPGDYRRRFAA